MNNEYSKAAVRKFLASVREARFQTVRCSAKIVELEAQCKRVTAQLTGMPGGGGDTHKDSAWAALADYREKLLQCYNASIAAEMKVTDFIALLPDPSHREILLLRYVDLLRWPQVLEGLANSGVPYSERQMFRLHGLALESARKIWEEQGKDEDFGCEEKDKQAMEAAGTDVG